MKFKDGKVIFLTVTLIDSDGKQYTHNSGGMGGDSFGVSFPNLSTNIKIEKIIVTASENVKIKKIFWHCYDPI